MADIPFANIDTAIMVGLALLFAATAISGVSAWRRSSGIRRRATR